MLLNYIDNIALTLLTSLLIKPEITFYCYDRESQEELKTYIRSIKFALDDMNICDSGIIYNLSECPLAITIINNNRESLINVLREYVNFYKSKKLIEPGDINTFETFEHLHNDLMLLVKDARVDITKYKLNDIKFAPVILANYFINNDFIGELLIDTAEPENAPYPIRIYKYTSNDKDEWDGLFEYWQEYFVCHYELNMEWYLKNYNKTKLHKPVITYPPQQQSIYLHIEKRVRNGEKVIYEDNIRKILGLGYSKKDTDVLNNAVKELNAWYRKIKCTDDKKVKIIKKKRGEDYYELQKAFILECKTKP